MSKSNPLLYPRVLNAVCKHAELRRLVVQQGGSKALIPLALDGTDKGTRCAALARIGITQDPAIAFLCCLFWSVKDWRTFENLASLNESTRKRILKMIYHWSCQTNKVVEIGVELFSL